jgi:hypothetical protein
VLGVDGDAAAAVRIASQQNPDIVIHLGLRADALALLGAIATSSTVPGAIVFDCEISNSNFMAGAGDLLENVIGLVGWTGSLQNCSHDRFTCAEDFSRTYFEEYSEKACTFAAGAAACGVVYQHGITEAKSIRATDVVAAIGATELSTFFSDILFDEKQANKLATNIAIQMQRVGKDLKETILWPPLTQQIRGGVIWPFRP